MKKANELLKGFRTVLVALSGFGLVFLDSFFGSLVGFGPDAIKGAAVVAGLVTIKQIKTDVIPRLRGLLLK
jgi:hypothetical protein